MATPEPPEHLPSIRFETRDPDFLSEQLAPLSGEARVEPDGSGEFCAALDAWKLPRVGLFRIGLDHGRAIQPGERDFVGVTVPLEGAFEVHELARPGCFTPGCAHVLETTRPFDLRTPRHGLMLVANLDSALVRSYVEAIDPGKRDVEFQSRLYESEPRAGSFLRHLRWVGRELQQEGTALRVPRVSREVEDTLAALLAEACLRPAHPGRRPATGRALQRAEEFLAAHLALPVSLPEVAEAAGVPVRTLTRAFEKRHGVGPIGFLRQLRLEAAHRDLITADPEETTVTAVALRYGLAHLGRFAGDYRRAFGETPSATLRRTG